MKNKLYYRAFGALSFIVSLITYLLTVQKTVPLWDCGEFSAASVWQQVPHPPGAPLFLMLGKLFHTIIPFGDPGWRINLAAVVSSAFTILLLYLITVKVIEHLRKEKKESVADSLWVYGSAFVGSIAFVFSDTFWFNAVESEVYATSTLFTAIVIYLMMRWNEEADNPGHERYLILIAYIIGLSTGVHLLAILTIFSITLLVYFRKYEFKLKTLLITILITILLFFIVYPGIVQYIPALLAGDIPIKGRTGNHIVKDNFLITILAMLIIVAAVIGVIITYRKISTQNNNNIISIVAIACTSFVLMIFGYSTYTQILIRSNANPPMNENTPKDFDALTRYLGREQYGESKYWPRRYSTESRYVRHYNEYGKWYEPNDDGEFKKINFSGEMNYLFKYQIYHMYIRYFLWNFVGRLSDIQDAGAAGPLYDKTDLKRLNYKNPYKDWFPIRFYALPLIFGLIGLFFHFSKDKKMATIYLILFLFLGVLAAIQQNQLRPQPRERDYFYAGSFMLFAMWISIGVYGIIHWLASVKKSTPIISLILIISTLFVPINMAIGGWKIHDRTGNYQGFDFSYNLLQSLEKDAILFTAGDNDTFPLWWLQDVAGVRRDVRIVNLSLGGTKWYVYQLRHNQPWGAKTIPLDTILFSDSELLNNDVGIITSNKPELYFNFTVDTSTLSKFDTSIHNNIDLSFKLKALGRMRSGEFVYPICDNDGGPNPLVYDIIKQLKFDRPVYFSITAPPSDNSLQPYLRKEGLAYRVCPIKFNGYYDITITDSVISNIKKDDEYTTTPEYGLKLRNMDDNKKAYYDEPHLRNLYYYRLFFVDYAEYKLKTLDSAGCVKVLDIMNQYISPDYFPMSLIFERRVMELYNNAGAEEQAKKFAEIVKKTCEDYFNDPNLPFVGYPISVEDLTRYEMMGNNEGLYTSSYLAYTILDDNIEAKNKILDLYRLTKEYYQRSLSSKNKSKETTEASFRAQITMMNLKDKILSADRNLISKLYFNGNKEKALAVAEEALKWYDDKDEDLKENLSILKKMIDEIKNGTLTKDIANSGNVLELNE